ncbi:MAG TPA: FkbM family methyltransferase, partial [candidate division Zixibacteria bacterium]|nr:FkbM family methyltransferase [candidate division Zixibacteria bacterium]
MPSKLGYLVDKLVLSINRKVLGTHVDGFLVNCENGIFIVDPEDQAIGGMLRKKGSYGLDEIKRLEKYLLSDSRVLVLGAHIGTLAIPIAKKCKEVTAIEANPNTYALLVKNAALNNAFNCRTFNIAAGDKEENIEFLLNRANSGGSKRVPKTKKSNYYYDNPKNIIVKSVSLDAFLSAGQFDLIIMDIEGSEYFALKGMPKILAGAKALAVEFEPHHLKNVSGISVEQFVSVIAPFFDRLTVHS